MNRSPRLRLIAAIVAVLFGAGGVLALVRYVQTSEERALAGEELVSVLVVRVPIPAGTPVTELAQFLEAEQVPAKVRAVEAVTALDTLDPTLVTTTDLIPGEQLVTARIGSARSRVLAAGLDAVPDGLVELTVSMSAQQALGGQLAPGDYVGIVASFDLFDFQPEVTAEDGVVNQTEVSIDGGPATGLLMRQVLVTNVQANLPPTFNAVDEEGGVGQVPNSDLFVTFAVVPNQAEHLVFGAQYGRLWLVRDSELAPDGSPDLVRLSSVFYEGAIDATVDEQSFSAGDPPAQLAGTDDAGPDDQTDDADGGDPADGSSPADDTDPATTDDPTTADGDNG